MHSTGRRLWGQVPPLKRGLVNFMFFVEISEELHFRFKNNAVGVKEKPSLHRVEIIDWHFNFMMKKIQHCLVKNEVIWSLQYILPPVFRGETLCDAVLDKDFLDLTAKAWCIREKS